MATATQEQLRLQQIQEQGNQPDPRFTAPLDVTQTQVLPLTDRDFLVQELQGATDPAMQDQLMDAIDALDGRERQAAEEAAANEAVKQKRAQQEPEDPSIAERVIGGGLRNIGAAVQIVATFGSGAIAEPIAGVAGLLSIVTGGDAEANAKVVNDVRDALTLDPFTARGKSALKAVAAPLMILDEAADTVATVGGLGNPYAETLIYTTLIGGPTLLGVKGGGRLKVTKQAREVQKLADELGVDLSETGLAASIIERAAAIVPEQRAANAPALRRALQEAKEAQIARTEQLRVKARRDQQDILAVDTVQELGVTSRERLLLEEGFDVDQMPVLNNALEALEQFRELVPGDITPRAGVTARSAPKAQLLELDTIRNRLEAGIRQVADNPSNPRGTRQKLALQELDNIIEEFTIAQFNKDMITGSPEQIAAWNQYNKNRNKFNETFLEDKAIIQLMDMSATPEQISRWLIGASAAGAKPMAAATIKRLTTVLGDSHPAIKGIRADYLYEVAAPLLQATPDFRAFLANYDRAITKNPSLRDALQLEQGPLSQLRQFAVVAEKIGPRNRFAIINDLPRAMTQFMFGHGIARASLRVRTLSNVLKLMLGKTSLSQKAILADIVGAEFGKPAIPPGGLAAGRFIQAAFLADITGAQEDVERKQ